jgi:hypothetical protein
MARSVVPNRAAVSRSRPGGSRVSPAGIAGRGGAAPVPGVGRSLIAHPICGQSGPCRSSEPAAGPISDLWAPRLESSRIRWIWALVVDSRHTEN